MKLIILSLAWAAIVAIGIFSALEFHKGKLAREKVRVLAVERAERELEIASAQKRAARVKSDEAQLQLAIQRPDVKPGKREASDPVTTGPAKRPDVSSLLQNNPTLRASFKQSFRAGLRLSLRPFYDSFALSPEQKEKFEEIATEAEQEKMDLESASAAQGLKANSPELAKLRKEMGDKLQAAQRDVLGEEGFQKLQQYQRSEGLFPLINMMAALVANTSNPITMSQVEQISDVLANSSSSYQGGGRANPATVDWNVAGPKMQALLAPAQYASFNAYAGFVRLSAMTMEFYKQERGAAK